MTGPTIIELDERIAMMRENINELVEQALRTPVPKMKTGRQTGSRSKSRKLAKLIDSEARCCVGKPYANGARNSRTCRGRVFKQLVARLDRASCHTLPSSGAVPPVTRER